MPLWKTSNSEVIGCLEQNNHINQRLINLAAQHNIKDKPYSGEK